MGLVRDVLSKSVDFVREEILPLRDELVKAGIITPEKTAYDMKASLVDPWAYGQMSYGYKEKYSILDYPKCRQITYADPIVASVIQTRLNQVAGFARVQNDKYKMGFKIKMRDIEAEPKDADKNRIKEITTFIEHCGVPENFEDTPEVRRRDSFEAFLRKITRDSLTFDQVNFEVIPRKDGKPYAFNAVDAATIRIIPDLKESVERFETKEREINVIDFGHNQSQFKEFKPKHPRFCQVIGGVIRHVFDEWEMAFGVRNPRTDLVATGYGFSEIEMLVTTITSHMNAETYNRKFFSQGSTIKGVLAFEGSVPPDQLEAFRRQWYQQVTGVNNAWRTPILALGKESKLNWTSLHSTNREMEFGKWMEYCIKTICGVFQMDPIEIGFDISKQGSGQSGGSAGLGQGNQAERISFSQDKGLRPLLLHIQSLINDYIVYRLDPNYEFEFVGLNVNSEKDDLDKAIQQGKAYKTINEIRSEHDLEDIDLEKIKKNPGELILDPGFIQYVTGAIAADKEQEQMDAGMGPDGQPIQQDGMGAPGEDPGPGTPEEESEPEPDYENMSMEELEAELAKLEGPKGQQKQGKEIKSSSDKKPGKARPGQAQPPVSKSVSGFFKELDL